MYLQTEEASLFIFIFKNLAAYQLVFSRHQMQCASQKKKKKENAEKNTVLHRAFCIQTVQSCKCAKIIRLGQVLPSLLMPKSS